MFERFSDFSNMDLSASSQHDISHFSAYNAIQKPQIKTTLPDSDHDDEPFFQKSLFKISSCYQISFQNNFMKEHQDVYEKELQKYMESQGILKGDEEFLSLRSYDVQIIPQNLVEYEKLKQFMQKIVTITPMKIMIDLLKITSKIVQKYQELKLENPDQRILLENANLIASQLNFGNERFLYIWAQTAMLVTGQYFQNPHYQGNNFEGLKRCYTPFCDEEDDDIMFGPIKRQKSCF